MMEYRVIWHKSDDALTDLVNAAIKERWLPQGGIAMGTDIHNRPLMVQAMMRYGPDRKEDDVQATPDAGNS